VQLSIIISTKDRGEVFTGTFIAAQRAIKNISSEIIVVNDSKTNEVKPGEKSSNVSVVNNPKSGVASARNLGASLAKSDLLLFIDDDMVISEESLQAALKLHEKFPESCINLNWVYPPELMKRLAHTPFGRFQVKHELTSLKGWSRGHHWKDHEVFEATLAASYFLLIPKKVFLSVDGYDENFPHAGFEDYDFPSRLKKKGVKFYVDPLHYVFHNEEDRMNVINWLNRNVRSGETRKVAVTLGYRELSLKSSLLKTMAYRMLIPLRSFFIFLLGMIPPAKIFDPVYFALVNLLQGISIRKGYYSR
jgi:GT2 family glycosyltransferase